MAHFYRAIASLFPKSLRKKVTQALFYANIDIESHRFFGFVIVFSLLGAGVLGFFLGLLFNRLFWLIFLPSLIILNGIVYLWLILLVDKKARLVEESLPDALKLMASNLRAGMTPDKALLLSSRPEFGPLKDEIDIVGKKVTLGRSIGAALVEMAERVRSKRLGRAVELINSGLESGGSLAVLLEATADNVREQSLIDKKIKAGITMYVIFIFSAASIISPVLFGLSSFLVEVIQKTFSNLELPTTAVSSIPIQISKVSISPTFIISFIVIFLIINNFMAAMLLGLMSKGKQRAGISYFVPMLLLVIPIFFLVRYAIRGLLGGLLGF
ncbi:MAG: type II secretion system F family protein [Nanoarchaeota archaeon]|nr:type II secretion system F family protein [Nanoarchaeota archaeon]MBU1644652.1 type II secretion system F family protein [Nanoarchaeota archaeon]MBU1977382.1 type II secretion system F family protein [Nanoarchaeota archaeon]